MFQIGSQTAPAVTSSAAMPTICVVDDDVGVLGSLRFLLETDGFSVRTFRSGGAALNAPCSSDVDCFVIDYKMPEINGIDLVAQLRSRGINAPVVLITGYPDGNIAVRAEAVGVKHVMRKPLLDDSLIKGIRGAIEEHRSTSPPQAPGV
jgi:two-component system, LuxR family, response regulator FixJ